MKNIRLVVLFEFWIFFSLTNSLQLSTSTSSEHYESYGIFWGDSPKHFNVTGQLVEANPKDGCSSFKNKDEIQGKIVLIDKDNCYPQRKMKHAKNAGAIGAIISAYQFAGQLRYVYDGSKGEKFPIATVEVSIDDFKDIKKSLDDSSTTVTIYPEKNPFDWMFQESIWVTWMVVFIPWNSGLIALAGYKLYRFIQAFGVEPSITQLSLGLLILSRIPPLLWSFDPKSYFEVWPDWLSSIYSSAHFPFVAGSYLLLAFYWQELVAGVKQIPTGVMPKLEKMKIPFAVVFFVLLGLEVGTWIPRALYLDTEAVTTLIVVIFVVILLAGSVFYFYQAVKILRVFRASNALAQKDSSRSRNLRRVTTMIVLLGALYVTCAILTGALGASLKGPHDIVTLYWTVYPLFAAAVTIHIMMFKTDIADKSSSEYSMQKTSDKTTVRDSMHATVTVVDDTATGNDTYTGTDV